MSVQSVNTISNPTSDLLAQIKNPLADTCTPAESMAWTVFKNVASIIFIPYGIYRLVNWIALQIIVPSVHKTSGLWEGNHKCEYFHMRIPVDGVGSVFARILYHKTAPQDKVHTWLLRANGNGELSQDYVGMSREEIIRDWDFWNSVCDRPHPGLQNMLALSPNVVMFDYPGVGLSKGSPTPENMQKAYRAVLSYIETNLAPKEIIGYGYSLGGGVQATALVDHKLKDNIKYAFIQDRSFSSLSNAAAGMLPSFSSLLRGIIRGLGLEMDAAAAIEKLNPQRFIILQHARCDDSTNANNDGVITEQAALSEVEGLRQQRVLITERHGQSLSKNSLLKLNTRVNEILSQQKQIVSDLDLL